MAKVLFILKLRDEYGPCSYSYSDGLSSGLFNSARLVVEMLRRSGVQAKLVQVVDNNDIDREVHRYRPTHVIIEGLWVVPEKFTILRKLHHDVKWIVRIHSEIPFLAMEGVAMDWIAQYLMHQSVQVACNSPRLYRDITHYDGELSRQSMGSSEWVLYLPNYYPTRKPWWRPVPGQFLRVGCFGAIRPLKNQLIQAMAAIEWASRRQMPLKFYMTHRDCEQGGDQVLRNLRALFRATGNELILRPWMNHDDFLGIMDLLDVGTQVSFSETFNIVAADMVSAGVPVVVSPEIRWASIGAYAMPTNMESIVNALERVTTPIARDAISWMNRRGLEQYSQRSRSHWLEYLAGR